MKNLFAIQGHDTRGKEVIEILEMLGGKNENEYNGENDRLWYYINDHSNISVFTCAFDINDFIFFTIDEFIKNFPYKVGDKVYNIIHNEKQIITKAFWCHIEKEVVYETDNNEYVFVNYIKPYKEETMVENTDTALAPDLKGEDYSGRRFGYKIPNGYEFECVNKNEIILKPIKLEDLKTYNDGYEIMNIPKNEPDLLQQLKEYFESTPREVVEKEWHEYDKYNEIGSTVNEYLEYVNKIRQPKYPNTYEECCKILMGKTNFQDFSLVLSKLSANINEENSISPEPPHITLINNFYKLLICRDAYWKIAREQMGLSKPWKPDWTDSEFKYCIKVIGNKIEYPSEMNIRCILSFPTEKMRDTFYENFKELIEECKEFL